MGCLKLQLEDNGMAKVSEDSNPVSSGVSLACMITSEVSSVLAVMRRNVRWGGGYVASEDYQEDALIQSLKSLRMQIFLCDKWNNVDPVIYLQPFLDVIRSEETGAPITAVALSSVYKILTLDVLDHKTINIHNVMHQIIDSVTSCRFEVTDPASEEVVLMKILQVLLACMKSKAAVILSNQHVCTIVNTCFRVVHQAGTKGDLLQRFSRHTMHELVRCIFTHLSDVNELENNKDASIVKIEVGGNEEDISFGIKQVENEKEGIVSTSISNVSDDASVPENGAMQPVVNDVPLMTQPYGVPCMAEIFHFLCSLLAISDHTEMSQRLSNPIAFDEDVPLFALGLVNSAIELGGPFLKYHPKLLALVEDKLFFTVMQFGLSMSPLIVSTVCNILLNLYHHLRSELKLQLEAFFTCVILRLGKSRYGASYQQQEVAMEALIDFCRQKDFMTEMYANLDCDITCYNVFEELVDLLCKTAFPVNCPLSGMHILALDGLVAVIQGMADRINSVSLASDEPPLELDEYTPFWTINCESYSDPNHWVNFLRHRKNIKKKLMIGVDNFNRDPKKGLEFLQEAHLLPDNLDAHSVACFFRYTSGLDKSLVGDFLGKHDEFWVHVLHEFVKTFDFQGMNLVTALRLFLESFRLPGESQKIQRVLEAFSERYYEHSPTVLVNKDAVLVLSYSLIMLNTDLHNVQVRRKMTEEDFIRNNRHINDGNDLPRAYLSELYHSICKNELKTISEHGAGFLEMTHSRWVGLMQKAKQTPPYITSGGQPFLDKDMFALIVGPTIAAISVVFEYAEDENVFDTCAKGFLAVAKLSSFHRLEHVLNDLVVSLCKFTTLLNASSLEHPVTAFGNNLKARLATETIFSIVNQYGDFVRTGWRFILDCILQLHKVSLLPACVTSDAADGSGQTTDLSHGKPVMLSQTESPVPSLGPRKASGLMGRFTQLLSLESEEPRFEPSEQQTAAYQKAVLTIQKCCIDSIFTESKFLHADSLLQLAHALICAAGGTQNAISSPDDEDTAVFCLELLISVTLNNRDRIALLWQCLYDYISNIVQTIVIPCPLVEKAVFGVIRICQRLLPYKENLSDELLRSLQLILKLDARVADVYCESITQEVTHLVKANAPHIKSSMGWRTITALLSITARHPEASDVGFEALVFIMSEGAFLSFANYIPCLEAARQFAESRVGPPDRSLHALDLMADSMACLIRWSTEIKAAGDGTEKICDGFREMWMRLMQGLKKVCLDTREDVRNHALLSLQKCVLGSERISLSPASWLQSFDLVIFVLLDDLLEIAQGKSPKDYRNMETTLVLAIKLLSKVFLQLLQQLSQMTDFPKLWLNYLSHMEMYMKAKVRGKKNEKLQELIPELLKNTLLVMKVRGILLKRDAGEDKMWDLTWSHVNDISPLLLEVFLSEELQQEAGGTRNEGKPDS